jgi:hypothetical protein
MSGKLNLWCYILGSIVAFGGGGGFGGGMEVGWPRSHSSVIILLGHVPCSASVICH